MNRLLAPILLIPALLLPACTEPTLREGLWELSFVDVKLRRKDDPRERDFPIPKKLVRVSIGPGEGEDQIAEFVYLAKAKEGKPAASAVAPAGGDAVTGEGADPAPAEGEEGAAPAAPDPKPMYAVIKKLEDRKPTVNINQFADASFIGRMWGTVQDPETILGSYLSGLMRYRSEIGIEGRWMMRWLREE